MKRMTFHSILFASMATVILATLGQANDNSDLKRPPLAMQSPGNIATESAESAEAKNATSTARDRSDAPMSSAEEKSVLQFAEREEPQLFDLLKFLKDKRPSAYQQALRETGRTQQKLENLQQRDPDLYQIESQLWKTRSKLSLVAARLSVKKSDELESQLKSLVTELDSQEIARIKLMRDRSAKQLEKWESQLKERTTDSSSSVEKNLEVWKSKIKKQKNDARGKN